jgi:cytidylate kinase
MTNASATHVVAIDGPAGAGKSTVARGVAERLGFAYLDTGAMYRAATWWALHEGVDLDDPNAVTTVTETMDLDLHDDNGQLEVFVNGHDITTAIRSKEVTLTVHRVSRVPEVRERIVALQRAIGSRKSVVAEGRDIGTVVFPNTACKVYIEAEPGERARRRANDLEATGESVDLEQLEQEIRARDQHDATRTTSPLRPAEDATILDTTDMTAEEAVDAIVTLANRAFGL